MVQAYGNRADDDWLKNCTNKTQNELGGDGERRYEEVVRIDKRETTIGRVEWQKA